MYRLITRADLIVASYWWKRERERERA